MPLVAGRKAERVGGLVRPWTLRSLLRSERVQTNHGWRMAVKFAAGDGPSGDWIEVWVFPTAFEWPVREWFLFRMIHRMVGAQAEFVGAITGVL